MNFTNIHQKNIAGLNFYGDVLDAAIEKLELSFQDLFSLSEEDELQKFEQQVFEDKNTKTLLVKMPEQVQKMSDKMSFFKAALQEDVDSDNVKKIKSIRYYADVDRVFYVQFIFEMN